MRARSTSVGRFTVIGIAILLAGCPMADAAEHADEAQDTQAAGRECGAWTLFPDFRCDDREARPEGTFNPMGMPFLFEDPHVTTGLNLAYVYHRLPEGAAFDGGSKHVIALQIRLAITDRLGFIATKDGLSFLEPGPNSVVARDTGWYDLTLGFKYALIDSRENDFILSPAVRYEIPIGNIRQFQNYGAGVFIPSASFRWGLRRIGLEGANLIGSLGAQIAADPARNVDSVFYNVHLDYGFEVDLGPIEYLVPFVEMNGWHYTRSAAGTNNVYLRGGGAVPLGVAQGVLGSGPFEGVDVANLGSQGIAGANIVVMGGGLRVPTEWGVSFGAMYEGPVTSRKDIHDGRFTFMATWEL